MTWKTSRHRAGMRNCGGCGDSDCTGFCLVERPRREI